MFLKKSPPSSAFWVLESAILKQIISIIDKCKSGGMSFWRSEILAGCEETSILWLIVRSANPFNRNDWSEFVSESILVSFHFSQLFITKSAFSFYNSDLHSLLSRGSKWSSIISKDFSIKSKSDGNFSANNEMHLNQNKKHLARASLAINIRACDFMIKFIYLYMK